MAVKRDAPDAAAAMAAPSVVFLDALETAPLTRNTGQPWVPTLPPIVPSAPFPTTEKAELMSHGTDIPGSAQMPEHIGETHNIAWNAFNQGEVRDALLAIYTAETLAGIVAAVVSDLEATTTTAPTIADAIATLDGAGYPATVVVADRAEWLRTAGVPPTAPPMYGGLDVIFAPVTTPLVACNPVLWLQVWRPQSVQIVEPSIGGYGVTCHGAYVLGFPPAAVCKVAAA